MSFADWLYRHRPTPTNAIMWRWRKAEAEVKALRQEVRHLKAALRESRYSVVAAKEAVEQVRREHEDTHERTHP